ncbi:hypothetical protein D3C76_1023040 [compost metagenome]
MVLQLFRLGRRGLLDLFRFGLGIVGQLIRFLFRRIFHLFGTVFGLIQMGIDLGIIAAHQQ